MDTICFDVGGTAIKYAVFNTKGDIISKDLKETPGSKKDFLLTIKAIVEGYMKQFNIKKISFSFPGYINPHTGYAETAGSIEYFTQSNILKEVEQSVGPDYQYYIENDANCAAIAEKNSGYAQENQSFLLLTVGTGLGGAFYINNQLIRGFQFKAGEFGRMRIQTDTDLDSKLNSLISVKGLVKSYKELKNISLDKIISGKVILDEIESDSSVKELVIKWIDNICVSIFNVVTVINPEKILLGGGVSAHPLFLNLVKERMTILDDWHEFKVPIETCKYLNDAGILGAYHNANKI